LIALAVEAEAEVVAERDEGRIVIAQLDAAAEGRWPARTGTGHSFGRRGDGHAPGNDQGQTRNGQRDGVRLLQGRDAHHEAGGDVEQVVAGLHYVAAPAVDGLGRHAAYGHDHDLARVEQVGVVHLRVGEIDR